MKTQSFEIKKLKELIKPAKFIAELAKRNQHFCLEAPMGAGKTTLINEVCKIMGVKEHTSSPTYSIVNEYITEEKNSIFHFDLYRINDETELFDIGMIEILDSKSVCFIEWPEKCLSFLPGNYVKIEIEVKNENRLIKITS